MRFPLFCNGAYRALSPTADDEQCINWYPEVLKDEAPGAVAEIVLYPTPGIETFLTVAEAQGGRAAYALSGRCWFVIGSKLVEVFLDKTYTILGDVGNDGRPAHMVSSGITGQQMLIASAGQVYCLDLVTGDLDLVLTTLDAVIEPGPAHYTRVGFSYMFFQAFDLSDSAFRVSAGGQLLDGRVWDGLDWQSRSLQGDPWLSMLTTSYGETWLMGELSSEVWYNNADPDFPYAPDPSGQIPYGIAAPWSLCEAADRVVWLATTADGDIQVASAQGYTPKRISDLSLEAEMDTYAVIADAEGETYRQAGHAFYRLTFPTERKTWLFDFQTNLWHRRGTWISEGDLYDEWHPTWYASFGGRHLWCDRRTGIIFDVAPEFNSDAEGRVLRRVRVSPTIRSENKRLTHKRIEVLIEAGINPSEPAVVNPQMMLRSSDDGGKTWGNELMQPMGDLGQYRQRLVWEKLGQSVARTYELSCTERMPVRVIDAFIEVE